tara:strand:+ start:88 stop:765 length:678 start_codon:yes stop_codon:yes gene_type:complete
MRTVIMTGLSGVVGFAYYCEPDVKKAIIQTVNVPYEVLVPYEIEVIKYVEVPVTNHIEVITYVNRPVLVKPNITYGKVPNWEHDMIEGVKFFEGFKPKRYKCCAGVPTIGYGCTDKKIVSKGSLSKVVATRLLLKELNKVRGMVRQAVTVDLTEHQLNALTSFTFNCGLTNLKTLINGEDRLNSGNYKSIEEFLPQYRLAAGKPRKGLEKRRAWELSLWQGAPVL